MSNFHTYDNYGYRTTEGFVPLLSQIGAVYKEEKNIEFKHTEVNTFLDEGIEDPVQLLHPFCGCNCVPVADEEPVEPEEDEEECNNAPTGETRDNG